MLTQVTNLKPGDMFDLDGASITVRTASPYGERETAITTERGNRFILANTNWFEVRSRTYTTCIETESEGKVEIFSALSLEGAYAVFYRVCNEFPGEFVSLTIDYRVCATRTRDGRYI